MAIDEVDKLAGNSRIALLELIRKEVITVQLILKGHNYERLSVVTGLVDAGGKSFVLVDCPEGLVGEVPDYAGADARVEFLGKDRVQYGFETRAVKIEGSDLCLKMPEYIEKVQRRQFFRIAPPPEAKMTFSRIGRPQDASLINVSEGGALVALKEPGRGAARMVAGEKLMNVRLRCVTENMRTEIKIEKAIVLREQADSKSREAAYAIEFLQLEQREQRLLQEFIFMCQREILRKRNELRSK